MTEQEYNIEVLCVCYSKETLKQQLKKKYEGTTEDGPDMLDNAFWNGTSQAELEEAISHYDEEQYKQIREEIHKDCQ